MAIHSTAFGVTRLTKEDSEKFRSQVTYGRPSKAAATTLKEGKILLKAMEASGSISVKIKAAK